MRSIHAISFFVLAAVAAAASAQPAASGSPAQPAGAPSGAGPNLREDVRQHDFAEHKQLMLQRISARISIATAAQACVTAATAPDQLKACAQQERAAMLQVRAQGEH